MFSLLFLQILNHSEHNTKTFNINTPNTYYSSFKALYTALAQPIFIFGIKPVLMHHQLLLKSL